MPPTLSRRRLALFALFFVPGVSIASWVTRTPTIRDLLHASTEQMGYVLFGLSMGSMIGIVCSGPLVARVGTRPIVMVGIAAVAASMPSIGVGAATSNSLIAALGLALFGIGGGSAEVAMNIEGADLEEQINRPVLPALHGCFSLGTVVGAATGILFTATGFPVAWHLTLVGIIGIVIVAASTGSIPHGVGKTRHLRKLGTKRTNAAQVWRDPLLLAISVIVLAMAFAEGAANDWLPLVMVDGHGFDAAYSSAIYAIFAAAMTIGRFGGGYFVKRYGRGRVLGGSAAAAAAGLALVIFPDSQLVAGGGVILWGIGTSLGFPVALSAAGDSDTASATRVSFVAIIGYVAFLVGPPVLGTLGEHLTIRSALIVPMLLALIAALLAAALRFVPTSSGTMT